MIQILKQRAIPFVDGHNFYTFLRIQLPKQTPATSAALGRCATLHIMAMRARRGRAEAMNQPPLEVIGHGVLQALGLLMDLVPLHREHLGQHPLDQIVSPEQPDRDVPALCSQVDPSS
jgi:hypothetical protein